MLLQVAGVIEAFVTQRTRVRLLSRVHSQMTMQIYRLSECLFAHVTLKWSLFAVNSAVHGKVVRPCKPLATNTTFKRFLSGMNPPMLLKARATLPALAAIRTLVFTSVNIHMLAQVALIWKTFPALITWIPVFSGSLGIMGLLGYIVTVGFNLYFKGIFTCIIYTTRDIISQSHFVVILDYSLTCRVLNFPEI